MKKLAVLVGGIVVAMMVLAACGASQTTLTSVDNDLASGPDSGLAGDSRESDVESGADSAMTEQGDASADTAAPTEEPDVVDQAVEAADAAAEATDSESETSREVDEFTDAELQCLEEAGYDPFDLIRAGLSAAYGEVGGEEEEVYNELFRCAPDWALSDAFVSEFSAGIGEGISGEVSNDEGRCVVQRLIDTGNGGTVLFGDPLQALEFFEACLTPENAAEILGAPGTGPQTYGDDAGFDLLQDRCLGDGALNDVACDLLYSITAAESDYEAVALTCGDREAFSDISCADDMFDNNDDLFIDPDSPGIAALEDSCRDGAMIACDYLYSLTEFDSSTEQLGGTCGDRDQFDGLNLCIDRFGETG